MAVTPTKKVAPTIRDTDSQYERENARLVGQVATNPLVAGKAVTGVGVSATSTRVQHRLGRPAIGFFMTDCTAAVNVWRDPAGANSTDYFYLLADSTATVNLWVF